MNEFDKYLNEIGEVGYVEEVVSSVVVVSGLPTAKPSELVLFETGAKGHVMSIGPESVEILLFSDSNIAVGQKVARTNKLLEIELGDHLLGSAIDFLGHPIRGGAIQKGKSGVVKEVDSEPVSILERKEITKPFETGVTIVDLVVPLAKGQRELVIGDRNTGKTLFLKQILENQAKKGTVCIYAGIAKKRSAMKRFLEFVKEKNISENTILVLSGASDPSGNIFLTPYTAMTIAEYFRDQGRDTLVILDDLASHAQFYREISLLARRFPGRNSYPGDIFYVHAKLLERAGSFKKASITCLPVCETIMGDLSGYIQTNLMSMTDGHIFFDIDRFEQGKLPAINPFLSVTRVGLQAQSALFRDIDRALGSYLVYLEKIRQYMHFGAELSENVKKTLAMGERLDVFFSQTPDQIIPTTVNAFLVGALWGGFWRGEEPIKIRKKMDLIISVYRTNEAYAKKVNEIIAKSNNLKELSNNIRLRDELILGVTKSLKQDSSNKEKTIQKTP